MATRAFSSEKNPEKNFAGVENVPERGRRQGDLAAVEAELRNMRDEFIRLRELMLERESKGRTLIDGYREVIADFADLFESQRNETLKRDESLRFFLSSIEGRLKTDIRNELSNGGGNRRGWWPFRRSR